MMLSIPKPITISLKVASIVSTAVLWYFVYKYLYKEPSEDESGYQVDEYSENYKVVKLKIPTYAKGAIIGKNGTIIKKIQDKTKTTIKFSGNSKQEESDHTSNWNNGDVSFTHDTCYDEIIIRGVTLRVLEAEKEIKNIVANCPIYTEDFLIVDNRFIGKLIGKKGENVKRLKDQYNVQLDIDRSTNPQRKVVLRGVEQSIKDCKADIIKMIDNNLHLSNEDFCDIRPVSSRKTNEVKSSLIKASNILTDWNIGGKLMIYISSVVDCSKFYAHIVSDDLKKLEHLIDKMTERFNKSSTILAPETINVGDILAGFYEPSVTWQRVKIIELLEDGFEALYVDYGDSEVLKLSHLRSFDGFPEDLELPFQAIRMISSNIGPIEEKWTESDINIFETVTKVGNSYPLIAELNKKSINGLEVSLTDESNGLNVADHLISLGRAQKIVNESK